MAGEHDQTAEHGLSAAEAELTAGIGEARRLMRAGDYERARPILSELRARAPNKRRVETMLGVCLAELDEPEAALEILRRSARRDGAGARARNAFVRALVQSELWDEAATTCEKQPDTTDDWLVFSDDSAFSRAFRAVHEQQASDGAADHLPVYYHLPFTAGTSLQVALHQVFGQRRFNIRRRSGLIAIREFRSLSDAALRRLRCVHLHHPFPIRSESRPLRFFTMLRDPVEHFVSGFYKRSDSDKIVATSDFRHATTLEGTLAHARKHMLGDSQVKQLAVLHPRFEARFERHYRYRRARPVKWEENLFVYAVTRQLPGDELLDLAREVIATRFLTVGVVEHFEASYLSTFANLGIPVVPAIPHRGRSSHRRHDPPPPEVVQQIEEIHPLDRALHSEVTAAFERSYAPLLTDTSRAPDR